MMKSILTAILFLLPLGVTLAADPKPVTAIKDAPMGEAKAKAEPEAKNKPDPLKPASKIPLKSNLKSPATVKASSSDKTKEPTVELVTNMGSIVIKLFPQKAPVSVKNFLKYVDEKFYDNTIFHRVMDEFMVQGGGFSKDPDGYSQKPTGAGIINEARNGLKNDVGYVAMARKGMSSWTDANSTTSQFFINVVKNDGLNYPNPDGFGYAVFGQVTEPSMKVVEKIKSVKTGSLPLKMLDETNKLNPIETPNVPIKEVVIITARRI